MKHKRKFMFEMIRGLAAIVIAIAVAFVLILLSSDSPGTALECLLIRPVFSGGSLNVKSIWAI